MKNMLKSLKAKLILSFLIVLLIPSISIGIYSYITSTNTMKEENIEGISTNVDLLNQTIDKELTTIMNNATYLSNNALLNTLSKDNEEEIHNVLEFYMNSQDVAESIFIATNDGSIAYAPHKLTLKKDYDARKRPWYTSAIKNADVHISEPFHSEVTGNLIVTISKKMKDVNGVIGVNVTLDYIQNLVDGITIGKNGRAFILDKNKNFIAHESVEPLTIPTEPFYDELYKTNSGLVDFSMNDKEKQLYFNTNELTGWKIGGSFNVSEVDAGAFPILKRMASVILIAMLLGGVIIFFMSRSIVGRINELKNNAIVISQGDLSTSFTVKNNGDEISELALAFQTMQESLKNLVMEVGSGSTEVASFTEQLSSNAEQTSVAAEQVSAAVQEVAANAEKQIEAMDRKAIALQLLSNEIDEVITVEGNINALFTDVIEQANKGEKAVLNTVSQMNVIDQAVSESNQKVRSLLDRSNEVTMILETITNIADQTNLLALNAAIEAARAGEAGKGFAVVANEVRKLAEQSQKSVQDISKIVKGIQHDTEESVGVMEMIATKVQDGVSVTNEAIKQFNNIVNVTNQVPEHMDKVKESTQNMLNGIEGIKVLTDEVILIAQENTASSEEVSASSQEQLASMEEISSSARLLSSMADELTGLVSKFTY